MTPATMKAELFPLTRARSGQRVRVSAIDGGRAMCARLCALGLTAGMAVEIVTVGAGPVILSVMGSRLVLGHCMAAKVLVRAASLSEK
ncbi:MAG: ferrous iron transport protein A [Planctomycetaceae bacterium]|nr:MAG: ferrous iron transport protein A [Planctomycetaceae bacterium]